MTLGESEEYAASKIGLTMPIRILFVSHDASMFGAQRILLTILSAMDRRIYSPMLVIPYEGQLGRAAAELGIPVFVERLVHWVPGVSVALSRRQRLRHLYYFLRTLHLRSRAIERLIIKHGVDIVYTNTIACVEGAIAAWKTRKPHVWHIHEHILRNSELAPLLPYRIYTMVADFLSESVIFCSKTLANDYQNLSGKAVVIYNGLSLPPLHNRSSARVEITKKLNINAGTKLVAVVGALHPRKDYLTFLAAAKQVIQTTEHTVFLIVGSGSVSYTNLIKQRVSDLQLDSRVRLLGWCDNIQDLMAAIDVLVISSEQESFGLTAVEALNMETPVVATRCGGPEEIVSDGSTGLLVPVKDACAMADAITRLLLNPEYARQLGVAGREYVSEHFGVDRYIHSIQEVIHETVSMQGNKMFRPIQSESPLCDGPSI